MRDWLVGGGFGLAWVIVMVVVTALERRVSRAETRIEALEKQR
ncbi:MAG TPA: hypothetical protein VHP62_01840 [Usitatibacter sp.]|jgi:hypothetical protein|nr:hypothetical protein [Usitatibacter sp.]